MDKRLQSKEKKWILSEMQERLMYTFNKQELLKEALSHSSYANEHKYESAKDNERLEFLGDAILDMIISEYLFIKHPKMPEGDLSKMRASIVCEASLSKVSASMGVGNYISLGKGEEMTGGRQRASILADAFEAITGAIFLDGGFDEAKAFLERTLIKSVEQVNTLEELYMDHKTLLQEHIQKVSSAPIHYEVTGEEGPDHDKHFHVAVYHEEKCLGRGVGKSKKEAEQDAAEKALNLFKN